MDEVVERLDRAIEYDPTDRAIYVLNRSLRLGIVPNLDEAFEVSRFAVKHAPGVEPWWLP